MSAIRVLLVEDEDIILRQLQRLLERNGYQVATASSVASAIALHPETFDIVLTDLRLPDFEGTALIARAAPVPVVIMTSHASVRSAVTAMQSGAIDYIAKPFDHDELLLVLQRALQQNRMLTQNRALRHDIERLLGAESLLQSPTLKALHDHALELLGRHHLLALHGERGCGREWLARMLHALGKRQDGPLLVADFPGHSPESWPALLFGQLPDTLSSSLDNNPLPNGMLRGAQGGTLVLRYADSLPFELQDELATLLENHRYSAHGHQLIIDLDAVLLSDAPLAQLVIDGRLSVKLAGVFERSEQSIPPLRELNDQIPLLAKRLLQRHARRYSSSMLTLSGDAEAAIRAYRWPGNLIELEAAMQRAVLVGNGDTITPEFLGLATGQATRAGARDLTLDEYFRYYVQANQDNLTETELAERLGISRKALWERRQRMGIERHTGG